MKVFLLLIFAVGLIYLGLTGKAQNLAQNLFGT